MPFSLLLFSMAALPHLFHQVARKNQKIRYAKYDETNSDNDD
jgi:hypothetical protein